MKVSSNLGQSSSVFTCTSSTCRPYLCVKRMRIGLVVLFFGKTFNILYAISWIGNPTVVVYAGRKLCVKLAY